MQVVAEATGVAINRTNATVGLVMNARQVVELPISPTRDVTRVALLSPNVCPVPAPRASRPTASAPATTTS